jgi:hypothetical protein
MILKCVEVDANGLETVSYVKRADMAKGILEFTDDRDEALNNDSWNCEMTLDWFRHHYKEKYPKIMHTSMREYD